MTDTRAYRHAAGAALLLGAVMTFGDFLWEAFRIQHRVVSGIAHGAAMCLCIGLVIGLRERRAALGAAAGVAIGMVAAGAFYLLAPALRWGAMLPAWMLFWILFAALQPVLGRTNERRGAIVRGLAAAVLSGIAFYLISGIWTRHAGPPNYGVNFLSWSFAFLPGFLALFWPSRVVP